MVSRYICTETCFGLLTVLGIRTVYKKQKKECFVKHNYLSKTTICQKQLFVKNKISYVFPLYLKKAPPPPQKQSEKAVVFVTKIKAKMTFPKTSWKRSAKSHVVAFFFSLRFFSRFINI